MHLKSRNTPSTQPYGSFGGLSYAGHKLGHIHLENNVLPMQQFSWPLSLTNAKVGQWPICLVSIALQEMLEE